MFEVAVVPAAIQAPVAMVVHLTVTPVVLAPVAQAQVAVPVTVVLIKMAGLVAVLAY
jgi:hypothetical protein